MCHGVGAMFDAAIDLEHAIGDVRTDDERHLHAWFTGMGILTSIDATLASQELWNALLDALDPVLWGSGERVG